MILTYEQVKAIALQVELMRGQAVINMQDGAGDIGFHVDINPADEPTVVTVDVSGGKAFYVRANGEVNY